MRRWGAAVAVLISVPVGVLATAGFAMPPRVRVDAATTPAAQPGQNAQGDAPSSSARSVSASDESMTTAVDRAFMRLYGYDFAGAHAVLDEAALASPDDPLVHAVRGAAWLFGEFDRLKILELNFFADDERVTDRRLKPDQGTREKLFDATAKARRLALARLQRAPGDAHAMFALCTAAGVETDYVALVEKRYFRSYSLSKESQAYARKLLAMEPPVYDAYLTLGSVEYVVGNLNFFFRLFVRFEGIEGSKRKAIDLLGKVAESGRYYRPFAKVLLAAIYFREKQPREALALLQDLQRQFPGNMLVRREIGRVTEVIADMEKRARRR
ncbi:MAG: hypothetical protein ACE148_08955 [Vicinamibacterales bacterium]